jgi:hypothetical protein
MRSTVRAYAITMDGEIAGLIGLMREGGIGKFFTEYKPELQPYLNSITIGRTLKRCMNWCRAYRGPVISIAETVEGCMALNRLGFEHIDSVYYGWFDKWHK